MRQTFPVSLIFDREIRFKLLKQQSIEISTENIMAHLSEVIYQEQCDPSETTYGATYVMESELLHRKGIELAK